MVTEAAGEENTILGVLPLVVQLISFPDCLDYLIADVQNMQHL